MNQQFRPRQFSAGSPLANILVVIAGILVISLSLAVGFVMFLGIAGFVLVMAIVMSVRNWWTRKRPGPSEAQRQPGRHTVKTVRHQIIEGEYREVRRHEDKPRDS